MEQLHEILQEFLTDCDNQTKKIQGLQNSEFFYIMNMKIIDELKQRIEYVKYTLRHRRALNELAKKYGYSFFWHDFDKVILYPILGKKLTHRLHRSWSGHHYKNGDIKNKIEAAFDWECARFTKPDKPLDAFETWQKYYPDVDMEETLDKLDFLKNRTPKWVKNENQA